MKTKIIRAWVIMINGKIQEDVDWYLICNKNKWGKNRLLRTGEKVVPCEIKILKSK